MGRVAQLRRVLERGLSAVSAEPHIVHVVPALFGLENVFGGAERFALELARAMSRKLPTTLVSFGTKPRRLRLDDLDVRVLRNLIPYRRFRFDPFTPALVRELARADLIHVHQPETLMSSTALVVAKALRKPIFSTHLGGAGLGLHRITKVDRFFDGHLHLSEFSRRHFGHGGAHNARAVLSGTDVDFFTPDGSERTDVVFIGRLLPHKGINYLVEAVDPDVPLTIVGRRWRHASKFDRLLAQLAEGKLVKFVEGKTFDEDTWAPEGDNESIREACRKALCVVLPSVHQTIFGEHYRIPELLGIVLLEGMACGAPAIVTDVCSLPEVVVDGVTGFVVPPNDAAALRDRIRWLRAHPEEGRRMGEAARKRVLQLFTWDRVVSRCLEAYGFAESIPAAARASRADT
jgi:glycosyltransferase involved in cell wall biosynthesis